ncbi:type IV pilus assembly protein PilX [Ferrimonas balearica DSM 9799]|uniref:Type IV pilus assembly protein PilX n=1 Tax=Ferrimonas balearica (strain DSM 9799 / CCM 4581 / KCTC 23876 / PAT) TaxID=550540 RepID=E1SSF9_FERBD|nr:hypothetical protein [Ferrimonas balearica]MBY6018961.1 hypothetical protein [Halomonas denitrificans]ADN74999.1 type IV pilus assembly protein PilX [Ferrimonas balearica DSM 9799]MBW3140804.1 pilus assembly protein PilX [Ferrimonas balearica]MBW3165219.1 pilus assembly protein PilX [Ferrimonas balearica]MBY5981570.1 pilus assembly protein PilX [Ferrimonas balearica]
MNRQQGMVLVVSILILLVLTLIAAGLASRATMTTQMASASNARGTALHLANGAQAGYVEQQRLARGASLLITNNGVNTTVDAGTGANNQLTFRIETQCRRSRTATASSVMACRQNELESTVNFGKNQRGQLSVVAGVEQPVLYSSGGL